MVSNLFGTLERTRFLFRDTLDAVRHLVELKIDPSAFWRKPWRYRDVPGALWHLRPKFVRRGPILDGTDDDLRQLPQLKCWPRDGGAFVTLPQVYTEDADRPGWRHSNLGMYRVQLSGNEYEPDREVGLHYQIHRGIGVHHAAALRQGVPFRVNVFVGGPPALTLAAVMPLPEGLPELAFAGALGGRRVPTGSPRTGASYPIPADADFCIVGTVDPDAATARRPVRRPPRLLQPGPRLPGAERRARLPPRGCGLAVHRRRPAAAGRHQLRRDHPRADRADHPDRDPRRPRRSTPSMRPASTRCCWRSAASATSPMPQERRPQELLTSANAILGQGQLSLAKYLLIVAKEDDPGLDIHDIPAFFRHLLERVDWRRDLHFQTRTTIDTLDYSGTGLNEGSKLVIAAAGPVRRELPSGAAGRPRASRRLRSPRAGLPGVLAVSAAAGERDAAGDGRGRWSDSSASCPPNMPLNRFPLVVLVDDSEFAARSLNNWLWVTFTRSNPAADVHGVGEFTRQKHWGCEGPLVIDARIKPHHAPPLEEDPAVTTASGRSVAKDSTLRRVLRAAERGGSLMTECPNSSSGYARSGLQMHREVSFTLIRSAMPSSSRADVRPSAIPDSVHCHCLKDHFEGAFAPHFEDHLRSGSDFWLDFLNTRP